jgi:hypothetical protein
MAPFHKDAREQDRQRMAASWEDDLGKWRCANQDVASV